MQGESPKTREYNVSKPIQDKRIIVARMPDNFKQYPPKYLAKRTASSINKSMEFSDLDTKDRNITLKKFKLQTGKSKEIEYQYILEDKDDIPEQNSQQSQGGADSYAKYNGIETKTDAKYYVLMRIDDKLKFFPVSSLIGFRKDMKLDSKSLEPLNKRKKKPTDQDETKNGKRKGKKGDSDSDDDSDDEDYKKSEEEDSENLSQILDDEDDPTSNINSIDGKKKPANSGLSQKTTAAGSLQKNANANSNNKQLSDTKSILSEDGTESVQQDDANDSDLSFDDPNYDKK